MLDLASVRLFILAVEIGNLTHGRGAGCGTGGVSACLKGLETALGRKLRECTPRYVRPTEDGVAFLGKARALMAAHDEAARFDDEPTMGLRSEPTVTRSGPDWSMSSGKFAQRSRRGARSNCAVGLPSTSAPLSRTVNTMWSSSGGKQGERMARCSARTLWAGDYWRGCHRAGPRRSALNARPGHAAADQMLARSADHYRWPAAGQRRVALRRVLRAQTLVLGGRQGAFEAGKLGDRRPNRGRRPALRRR